MLSATVPTTFQYPQVRDVTRHKPVCGLNGVAAPIVGLEFQVYFPRLDPEDGKVFRSVPLDDPIRKTCIRRRIRHWGNPQRGAKARVEPALSRPDSHPPPSPKPSIANHGISIR